MNDVVYYLVHGNAVAILRSLPFANRFIPGSASAQGALSVDVLLKYVTNEGES